MKCVDCKIEVLFAFEHACLKSLEGQIISPLINLFQQYDEKYHYCIGKYIPRPRELEIVFTAFHSRGLL